MAFFSKLKDRLFKSSAKIDEGLEAIVQDNSAEEAVVVETPAPPQDVVEREIEVVAEHTVEVVPESEIKEPAPEPVVETPPVAPAEAAPAPVSTPAPEPAVTAKKSGILSRIFGQGETKEVIRRVLDDEMLEQLEELLISTDMGVDTALRVTANMAEGRMGKKLSVDEIKSFLAAEIARIMEPVARPLPIYPKTPQVVLVVGVNGSGKTTTIGKLASQFRAAGKNVVIAAGDTFRAAAVEQLQVWGERAGVPVLTAPEGSDPASLAFDAMTKAHEDGADLLLIDTAGRLQNRGDLMEELEKIVRVIRKKDETAPHNTLLVLDATTGQNAVNQVKVFQEVSDVSGLVMTKLDGTAKGGVLVSLADKFGLPIHAIGVGEQIDDLFPFDPEEFAAALTGAYIE
jgi:fused signal recognition particle receptor